MKINRENIYVIMAEQQKSSAELARDSSITKQSLSRILSNGSCRPETAGRIAKALGVDVRKILQSEWEGDHAAGKGGGS